MMRRRELLRGGMAAAVVSGLGMRGRLARARAWQADSPVQEMGIRALGRSLTAGEVTSRRLVEAYLQRIAAIDRDGPALRSILETNPEAREIAGALDAERRSGRTRGPLHGIPIVLKDNIDTGDRMLTTAGSLALAGASAPRDAFIAARLRQAGAIILAKANLSEWANFRSTRSSSGWSARGGQVRNPYVLDRSPCGSSSGSGAAAAASLCAAAIGTETDGSIVCPSSANSLVGIKPTVGLCSRSGIVPISHTQDSAGPMARTVEDAAMLLGALTGADPRDPATSESAGRGQSDYTGSLDPGGLRGARIGVARNLFGFHERVDALMEDALVALREGGAEIVDPAEIPNVDELGDPELQVLVYEFKADLEAYLATRPGVAVRTLADVIAFNERHRDEEMPWFGQEIFEQAQAKGPLSTPEYQEALEKAQRLARQEGIDAVLQQHRLDALVAPTDGPPWPIDLVNGDHYVGGSSSPAAVAGYPTVTVPAGYVAGLPVGISFIGTAWSEPTLIRLAYAFEQATQLRRPPGYLPTLAG